jgi:prepilin-type N-terminal cleavage/methylation domain-containing protein
MITSLKTTRHGFTLIELLVVIVIIGILASLLYVVYAGVRAKARDVKRKADISMIGRFLTQSCYLPDAGVGTYDFVTLITELKSKDSRYQQAKIVNFQDPKSGSTDQANYFYIVDGNNKCAIYANLENESERIDLSALNNPTPGGGSGILQSASIGPNGTGLYYQVSN